MNYRRRLVTLLLAGATACAWAQDGPRGDSAATAPLGEPVAAEWIQDPDFGVRTSRFGLDRRVEMYQWQRDGADGYQQVWKPALVDSTDFDPGYENPPAVPLESRIWWASEVTLDGKPVELSVIKTLGQWEDFRPSFTRLPVNLVATFQPEGDGLGSALNPLDPRTGDVRIHWRALQLPPLTSQVELRDGKWQLVSAAEAGDPVIADTHKPDTTTADGERLPRRGEVRLGGKIVLGVLFALGVFLVRRIRRKRRNR